MVKVTKYVNVYHTKMLNDLWTGNVYDSKEEAIAEIAKDDETLTFLKTIEVEISPNLTIE